MLSALLHCVSLPIGTRRTSMERLTMRIEQLRPISIASAMLVASMLIAGNLAQADTVVAGISPVTAFTPLVSQVLTTPQPVKASDGNYHIAYELLLTNAIGV